MSAMASPATSTTAAGCCTFDDLCSGNSPGYACDFLIDLKWSTTDGQHGVLTLSEATRNLISHVYECIRGIEKGQECKVEQFYIGKTHTHKRKKKKFKHMDHTTWRKSDGISKRFRAHRKESYGRDGLVVLTMVTRKTIPPTVSKNRGTVRQELYAFALENRLIQHFLIECDDVRIKNRSLGTGKSDGNKSVGYPIYMVYTLEDKESESSDSDSDSDNCSNSDNSF